MGNTTGHRPGRPGGGASPGTGHGESFWYGTAGPVPFGGLGWDYGGGASWTEHEGSLDLILDLDPASDARLTELGRTDPRVEELFGDRTVRSDHPVARQLTFRVSRIGLAWGAPFDERDCESLDADARGKGSEAVLTPGGGSRR